MRHEREGLEIIRIVEEEPSVQQLMSLKRNAVEKCGDGLPVRG
jgi:hypothetical protein